MSNRSQATGSQDEAPKPEIGSKATGSQDEVPKVDKMKGKAGKETARRLMGVAGTTPLPKDDDDEEAVSKIMDSYAESQGKVNVSPDDEEADDNDEEIPEHMEDLIDEEVGFYEGFIEEEEVERRLKKMEKTKRRQTYKKSICKSCKI